MRVSPSNAAAAALAVLLVGSSDSRADEMPVPTNLQVALLKKIFDYDRTLPTQRAVRVAVVHEGPEGASTRELVKEFRNGGVEATALPVGSLEGSLGSIDVLYVSPGVDPGLVQGWCVRQRVLSVSGLPDLATTGKVSVGIGLKDQKPEILVHIRRVKSEGHELASGLLNLATVIR
jgi:hypothetical protein